jgi:ppGpp synthetase/RelA/SpoT-type nucleotidyltranferase
LKELEKHRSETALPGYWNVLEENCSQWAEEATISPFWKSVKKNLPTWSSDFQKKTGSALLATDQLPPFIGKKTSRIQAKLLQRSSKKTNFDLANTIPSNGAPVPILNDLVRTRIQCQFLDGVEFLVDRLAELTASLSMQSGRAREGRLEGYFAQHFYFNHDFLFRLGGSSQPTQIKCEVQVATQLSTRIWDATHLIYEEWREQTEQPGDWQWNPEDPRFLARQLGHMIHLADGILVQLRNSIKKNQTP